MSIVFSIDPVGTTNAWSSVVVPNSRIKIVTHHSAMKCRAPSTGLISSLALSVLRRVAMDEHERTSPACFRKEILHEIKRMIDADCRAGEPVSGCLVGPVDDQR